VTVEKLTVEIEHSSTTPSLYQRLMGPAWGKLHESVRRAHASDIVVQRKGYFRVVHGHSRFAQFLVWFLRMPQAMESGQVLLKITPHKCGEDWLRKFDGRQLVTTQREASGRILVEKMGHWEFRFHLEVVSGYICYRQKAFGLRFGPFYLPLPDWMSPQVVAREGPGKASNQTSVFVKITAPLAGLILMYEGDMEMEKTL